ncbi:MAG: hypothetical protein M3296_10160, partial [Actinomycetota bacterium]|nr:hypothetical protein [Actinomycetota bacterium]
MSRAASPSAGTGWARVGLVLVTVLVADQAVKALITSALERGERDPLVLGIELVNVRNSGVAFGALQGAGTRV